MRSRLPFVAVSIAVASSSAAAQQQYNIALGQNAAKHVVVIQAEGIKPIAVNAFDAQSGMVVAVSCTAPVSCATIHVKVATPPDDVGKELPVSGVASEREKRYTLAGVPLTLSQLIVVQDGVAQPIVSYKVQTSETAAAATTSAAGESAKLASLLQTGCPPDLFVPPPGEAAFVVGPRGNVLMAPRGDVTTSTPIVVYVVADRRLGPALDVKRTSAFPLPGQTVVLGGGLTVPVSEFTRQAQDDSADACRVVGPFRIGTFSVGRGEVTITALTNELKSTTVGTFDFPVHAIYQGALSLGVIRTKLSDGIYGLRAQGADSVIHQSANFDVLYALMYNMYLPLPGRDVDAPQRTLFDYVHPSVGVVLNDLANNVIYGVSVDAGSAFYLFVGGRTGRVTILDPASGYDVGSVFPGSSGKIPTRKLWRTSVAIGASLDLRVAAQLLGVMKK